MRTNKTLRSSNFESVAQDQSVIYYMAASKVKLFLTPGLVLIRNNMQHFLPTSPFLPSHQPVKRQYSWTQLFLAKKMKILIF